MKPNWKACAKRAFERGREQGRRDVGDWIPSRDPPKKPGTYECVVVRIIRGKIEQRASHEYFDGDRWSILAGDMVTHWKCITEFPPIDGLVI